MGSWMHAMNASVPVGMPLLASVHDKNLLIMLIVFGGACLVLVPLAIAHTLRRGRRLVEKRVKAEGLEPVSMEARFFRIGPFSYVDAKHYSFFRVTARAQGGRTRFGYARAPGFITGLYSKDVELRWDDSPR